MHVVYFVCWQFCLLCLPFLFLPQLLRKLKKLVLRASPELVMMRLLTMQKIAKVMYLILSVVMVIILILEIVI